jgi:hypothetical protein
LRLSENAHLPFDMLTALSKAEGLRYPHPASRRYRSLAVIPRDFVPQQSLRDGHFPSASERFYFSTVFLLFAILDYLRRFFIDFLEATIIATSSLASSSKGCTKCFCKSKIHGSVGL